MSSQKKESQPEKITVIETEQRLRAVLKGAFNGPPTPHKAIPKKGGSPKPLNTKAEHAAFKRSNKTAFKPAPKKS